MAVVKYSAIVTELKGKVGGQIFQASNNSLILRNTYYKKGSSSEAKSAATSGLVSITNSWKSLTDTDRGTWNDTINDWAFTDKFGNVYFGPGFQYFSACNRYRSILELDTFTTAPLPTVLLNVGPFEIAELTTDTFTIVSTLRGVANSHWLIYASPNYSAGRNNNNPRLKLVTIVDATGVDEIDISDDYLTQYGALKSKARIIVKIVQVQNDFPYPRYPYTLSAIVE